METGLGGKYDSVTACNAKIIGITSISMDHENFLGDNLHIGLNGYVTDNTLSNALPIEKKFLILAKYSSVSSR